MIIMTWYSEEKKIIFSDSHQNQVQWEVLGLTGRALFQNLTSPPVLLILMFGCCSL